jgi:hypothetical protein
LPFPGTKRTLDESIINVIVFSLCGDSKTILLLLSICHLIGDGHSCLKESKVAGEVVSVQKK